MFTSIFDQNDFTFSTIFFAMLTALLLGFLVALTHMKTCKSNKNFLMSLCILPILVQMIIVMVNGNVGTSVAVLGAFSLIRFRSVPGNSREILSIFLTMAIGLALGMGYLMFAFVTTLFICLLFLLLQFIPILETKKQEQKLKITIPENLDYSEIFDDIFKKYTETIVLERVKTTNMGSLFELQYEIVLKDSIHTKEFLDELRCRNGNLSISLSRNLKETMEL